MARRIARGPGGFLVPAISNSDGEGAERRATTCLQFSGDPVARRPARGVVSSSGRSLGARRAPYALRHARS